MPLASNGEATFFWYDFSYSMLLLILSASLVSVGIARSLFLMAKLESWYPPEREPYSKKESPQSALIAEPLFAWGLLAYLLSRDVNPKRRKVTIEKPIKLMLALFKASYAVSFALDCYVLARSYAYFYC